MKLVSELELGSNDAEDYKRKEMKQLFNEVFLKDHNLDKLLQSSTFFLMGEKGTGKTAYAVFLANNEYKNTRSQIKYIRETQYQKFVSLKMEKHLNLSDYAAIWRVILLVLLAANIKEDDINNPFSKNQKLKAIRDAIDNYYNHAFSPEIAAIMQMVDHTKETAELLFRALKFGTDNENTVTFSETKFQTNLNYIEKQLLDSLLELKLSYNQFLFVDGIDIRPNGIEYKEYLSCVKGLSEAVWSLNNDQLCISNGSKGRMKIVILIRPDIFQAVGLQNSTNKIRNNSVFLDWRTTYPEHRNSNLFKLADKLLTFNQQIPNQSTGYFFDHYFKWQSASTNDNREVDTPFIDFLRLSYSRPRDIVTIMQTMQIIQTQRDSGEVVFQKEIFKSKEFLNSFSEYLMGGIKDQLAFYYSDENFQMLMHFLSLFKGHAEFEYSFYCDKYKIFCDYVLEKATELPEFIEDKELFLQFLYDSNIICYIDDGEREPLFRWCYRERNVANMSPKVETEKKYRFHYGLLKALNLGSY